MLTGVVPSEREAILRLTIRGPHGKMREVAAVLDTGFNGYLTLPTHIIEELSLPYQGEVAAQLADGGVVRIRKLRCTVELGPDLTTAMVLESDADPLLGMALLEHYRLTMDVTTGGSVCIEPLASATA